MGLCLSFKIHVIEQSKHQGIVNDLMRSLKQKQRYKQQLNALDET